MNTYSKMSKPQKDYYPEAATRELFVGNLSKGAEVIFKELDGFSYFQPDREGRPYGFIGFKSAEQCNAALEELTGKMFKKRIIEVRRPNSYVPPKITKQTKKMQQKLATEKWEEEETVLANYEKAQKEYIEQSEALKYFEEQKKLLQEREQKEKDQKILELQQQLEYYKKRDQEILAKERELEQKRLFEQQRLIEQQQRLEQQRLFEQHELQQRLEQQRLEQQQKLEQQRLIERQQQDLIEKQKLIEQLHKFNFEVVSAEQYSLIQEVQFGPETEAEKSVYFGLKDMKSISGLQPGSVAEILYNALYYKYRHYNLLGI